MEANGKIQKLKKSKLYKDIKKDLLDQLEHNCTSGTYYIDLVDDYMDMWVMKCLLVDDIQENGITVVYNNGGGQTGRKKNDSVEQRIKVNVQMLKLLSELGITPSNSDGGTDVL